MNHHELVAWKEKHGCNWRELGDAIGVAPNTIRRWSRGDLGIGQPKMLKLALERLAETGVFTEDNGKEEKKSKKT